MPYITTKRIPKEKQLSMEDLLYDRITEQKEFGPSPTITYYVDEIPEGKARMVRSAWLTRELNAFRKKYATLYKTDKHSLYSEFYIPKRTGGLRKIDAPCDELKKALTELTEILTDFGALHHTAAFAYIEGRCTKQAVMRHQANESNWFLKTDLSDFFGSTNERFVQKMLLQIYPFCVYCRAENCKNLLFEVMSLCFLDDGLPQGTPISPWLTNIIFAPIDYRIFNTLASRRFVYTRYADDMIISCIQSFKYTEIVGIIDRILREFSAPYVIKDEKTHYGSRRGRNYCLGLMLNAKNDITVGYSKKKTFKAMMNNFILDTKNGKKWSLEDVQAFAGILNYYEMIEKDYFENMIDTYNKKYQVNFRKMLQNALSWNFASC